MRKRPVSQLRRYIRLETMNHPYFDTFYSLMETNQRDSSIRFFVFYVLLLN